MPVRCLRPSLYALSNCQSGTEAILPAEKCWRVAQQSNHFRPKRISGQAGCSEHLAIIQAYPCESEVPRQGLRVPSWLRCRVSASGPTCPSARRDRLAAWQNRPRGLRPVALRPVRSILWTSGRSGPYNSNQRAFAGCEDRQSGIAKGCCNPPRKSRLAHNGIIAIMYLWADQFSRRSQA